MLSFHSWKAESLIHFSLNFPTVDLIDVSLVQHILSSEQSQRKKQISLKVQQISGMLTKLFQRVRLEKPGQVDPRAAGFTLSLLAAMYDRWEEAQNVNPLWSIISLFLPLLHHFCIKLSHFYGTFLGIHNGNSSAIGKWGTNLYQRKSGQMFQKLSGSPDICQSMLMFSVNNFTESSSSFECHILIHS